MKAETINFIKDREPFTNGIGLKVINDVSRVKGGTPHHCYKNAQIAKKSATKSGKKVDLVSGWMVQNFSKQHNALSIIAHWWNRDSAGKYFDTTPIVDIQNCEYVEDLEIFKFCIENDAKLSIHQHYSLLYIDGAYEALIDEQNMRFRKIKSLQTANFYN